MREIKITERCTIYNDMPRGWVNGKNQPKWHSVIYDMWKKMWDRVYKKIYWFGSQVQESFIYLSKYISSISKLENFDKFKENPKGWCIDKDSKIPGNRDYYLDALTLMTRSDNAKEVLIHRNKRYKFPENFNDPVKNPKRIRAVKEKLSKAVIGISIQKRLVFKSMMDAQRNGFHHSNISSCCKGKLRTYKGFTWHYLEIKEL